MANLHVARGCEGRQARQGAPAPQGASPLRKRRLTLPLAELMPGRCAGPGACYTGAMAGAASIDLLRALEIFLGVAETGSMTAASRHLNITQSAISQHMKL